MIFMIDMIHSCGKVLPEIAPHVDHNYLMDRSISGLNAERNAKKLRVLDTGTSFRKTTFVRMEKELPRLTNALREFGGVSSRLSREPVFLDEAVVLRKRDKGRAEAVKDQLSWSRVVEDCAAQCSKQDGTKVRSDLRELQQAAREIVGSDVSQTAVDSAAVFLFNLFITDPQLSRSHAEEIRKTLGPFPASAANKVSATVKRILTYLPASSKFGSSPGKTESSSDEKLQVRKEFGHNISFKYDTEATLTVENGYDSLSDDEASTSTSGLTQTILSGIQQSISKPPAQKKKSPPQAAPQTSTAPLFSGEWLKMKCQEIVRGSVIGMTWQDLYAAIFDLLSSSQESASIENDLAELLGLSQIELIQDLLTHRREVVDSVVQEGSSLLTTAPTRKSHSAPSLVQPRGSGQGGRPAYGSQVVIQSEQEKQLKKFFRKEEKRMAKQAREMADSEGHVSQLRKMGYDPVEMRKERERALEAAANRPIFSGSSHPTTLDPSALYPHVYDSLTKVKLTSAFLAGAKVGIPEDAKRTNDRMMEEIMIPHTSVAPPPIGDERIRIDELDDIAKLVFKGTKTLNRIQTVVFDAAYYTNENLLISAPTGAGKTNIAMLTVLHEIKNNIESGVIQKDKFKVIYVAPMKALAAEMVRNFGRRLAPLGVSVRELTGDMQLTKYEIQNTQMIVTTPEKWDVVTRKSTGDVQLAQVVRLLIIDEVHLLHEGRGAVIESLVARTLRQVESSQKMIRIVGLSATLPNYLDVARFLRVNPYQGLFFFDGRFRPVPLSQTFIGIKTTNQLQALRDMDEVCYDKVLLNVKRGYQVMVFVHSRNGTVRTATALRDLASSKNNLSLFQPEQSPQLGLAEKQVSKSRNKPLRDLFADGFSIHHAGMLRQDRTLVERLFSEGLLKVLVCTATLAWGVNLPAHAVIIKGTQIYDAKKGSFVDLGILDVLQIFGRAGRPQFDTFGEGTIITSHDKLSHYLSLLTRQQPIESQFVGSLTDNLNAEIALGTVSNIDEAVQWMSYTFLFVRMLLNPLVYGVSPKTKETDPHLETHQRTLITLAANKLDKAKMIRYVEHTGTLHSTDLGRTASHYYIKYASIETFNELLKPYMNEGQALAMVSKSEEFEQVKVREDEIPELEIHQSVCRLPVQGGVENSYGKVNILLQTYIGHGAVDSFSLTSDLSYVAQNSGRILRGLFEIVLRKGLPVMSSRLLTLCKCVEHQQWAFEHPLKQFKDRLSHEIITKLEEKKVTLSRLRDMTHEEIGHMIHHVRMGRVVETLVRGFPSLSLAATIQPITRTVLRVRLTITPVFEWSDKLHGMTSDPWWIWVEDAENNQMYHSEYFLLQKKQVLAKEQQDLVFTIPIFEPLPPQYYVRAISDRWLGAECVVAISFQHLILPELHPPHTKLLNLHPLPISALKNPAYESLYRFGYFNPVQTQVFHTLYHSDTSVLLGAPTGSGKTVAAELAIFRVFNQYPGGKAVYIAPLKALVRERVDDWRKKLEGSLGKTVVELTGDTSPDIRAIEKADVIVTTPEKWDGISRSWQNRSYVQAMRVLIIDEIHLLGDERGPVLEVIVSRTNYIASYTQQSVRVVGLSTALANAKDLADWLCIKQGGLFNFHPAVRPVQLEVHIDGFPGKHYCPRMATMNKPAYTAIKTYSPDKPVLIFVSSRRQTRLTAFDLVAFVAAEDNPKQWLHMPDRELDSLLDGVLDQNLKFALAFGVGIHHAGLQDKDRKVVEELFVNQKIQILIATSTLAWGVNFPAHLVVVKGTEYFDGKLQRYVDYPITDVLQMMGRAGRPQYDDRGVAVILVHDIKKHFYKKFLYEPFPVESNLLAVLADHINAEIVAGTITSKQDAMDYVTWTYFFRRLIMNPSFYQLEETSKDSVNSFLSRVVAKALSELESSYCIQVEEDERTIQPLTLGCIASFYYLHHSTVRLFREKLYSQSSFEDLLQLLCDASEYNELPVRHNEDLMNSTLAKKLPLPVSPPGSYDSPHSKAHLLLQAHFSRSPLPIADYQTDTKSVLDQALRILQALVDISANEGWLSTTLKLMLLVQMCVQGRWVSDSSLLALPHVDHTHIEQMNRGLSKLKTAKECGITEVTALPELLTIVERDRKFLQLTLAKTQLSNQQVAQIQNVIQRLPIVTLSHKIKSQGRDLSRAGATSVAGQAPQERQWTDVPAGEECVVHIELTRRCLRGKNESKIHAPKFPKSKDEGWWLVLGEVDVGELLALKRIGFIRGKTQSSLAFLTPEEPCRKIYSLYLMSDCYLGLDQQFDLSLNFVS